MAIAVPVSLGRTGALAGTSLPWTINTGAAVPAGGFIVAAVSWYGVGVTATLTGGGLTWTLDKQQDGTLDTGRHVAAWSAQAPSGLAINTTLTVTPSGVANNKGLTAAYTTGIVTSSPVDGTPVGARGTATNWSSGSQSTGNPVDLLWTVCHQDGLGTNTQSGGTTELDDFQNSTDSTSMTTGYQIASLTGSYAGTGTWTAVPQEWMAVTVAYKGVTSIDNTNKPALLGMFTPQLRADGWF